MAELRLAEVTQDNVRAACGLEIRPEQKGLVALVAWSLAAAYTAPEIAWPRLVYDGDQLVGFIMGAFDPDGEVELFRSFLWRLNIGAEHQGKGYGRFAVEELCAEALRRGQHRLMVSWKQQEHGPEGFYMRLGFRLTGEHNQGEVIAERILAAETSLRCGS
ncbi:MAG: GNAT family N-acetyltransferase [Streptosporangiaceae bacterium]